MCIRASCDAVVSVLADDKLRLERIVARDNITTVDAKNRMSSQHDEMYFRQHSTYIIENNSSIDEVRIQTDHVFAQLISDLHSEAQ